ncbi:MAG: glycoside hydrolase family 3 C-terminal domain-containing protein, partial [Dysgonamonadaceae bacterium]|nr:glycoside hydrolase family 3 C-terminal domain-containing protein [Dysgonamonadaceae bacterium]
DYSGYPVNSPVSVLEGIREKAGKGIKIVHAPWVSALDGYEMISPAFYPEGLQAEYFSNKDLAGEPKRRKDEWINYEPANQAPDPFLPKPPISIRWKGKLRPTVSGTYTFAFTSDDGCRLYIDGKKIIDAWAGHSIRTDTARIELEAGKDYQLQAEYYDNRDAAMARLSWRIPATDKRSRLELYGEAGKAVRECDMTIAVLGINKTIEREGKDRDDIHLPKDQEEFIREIYKVNPNTVVVLVAGSSQAIGWINENIPAIVNAWYPGEQGGTAVAEVLFGEYNPAGRLPLTYYNSLDELPPFNDYDVTKGRTYQYFTGKPLYPFGYGLSYSSFQYKNLTVREEGENIKVSFDVKNTGKTDGSEVAQLYVKLPDMNIRLPQKQLKGFKRVFIRKGQTEKVEIIIPREQLRYWDDEKAGFVVPSGVFRFMAGASSEDIRLTGEIRL